MLFFDRDFSSNNLVRLQEAWLKQLSLKLSKRVKVSGISLLNRIITKQSFAPKPYGLTRREFLRRRKKFKKFIKGEGVHVPLHYYTTPDDWWKG